MADYLHWRATAARAARGAAAWAEGLNYEVGALSEVYAQASWIPSPPRAGYHPPHPDPTAPPLPASLRRPLHPTAMNNKRY